MAKVYLAIGLLGFVRVFGYFTDPKLTEAEIHRVVGEPARVRAPATPIDGLKVITWNIERGQAYEAVLAMLRELDADVLLLQEVDRDCRRTDYRDVARDLAHALDMNWVGAGEFQEIGEARDDRPAITGQAVLSRFPIEDASVLRFQAQDRWRWSLNPVQPRRGGRVALKARTAGVIVYDTHIESGGNDSLGRRQISEILADHAQNADSAIPVVIGGDFNNIPVQRASLFGNLNAADFTDALGAEVDRGPTSFGQRHPIDWIFVRNLKAIRGRIVLAPIASDHFPVVAAFATTSAVATR
jgi:endonuclease/exonuclease/phosphatase family metal-dependent hydrolase